MHNKLKNELQNIISGKSQVSHGKLIQTIANYLSESEESGVTFEEPKYKRKQETIRLEEYLINHNLILRDIDFNLYVSEGAEQRVYLVNNTKVIKLNDAIYYENWIDYLHNLLLHNFFFPDTAYELKGFTFDNSALYAVVEQSFIESTQSTDLVAVKSFLLENGFQLVRNNDYFHSYLGIILEDLHDENVLTNNGILYFIDTVFYLTASFWILNE